MTTLVSMHYGPQFGRIPFAPMFSRVVDFTGPQSLINASAVVFWGGTDISPELYGEVPNQWNEASASPSARDISEWEAMQYCRDNGIMMIGVCRGMQLMTVFAGGKLAQDVGEYHLNGHRIMTSDGESFFAAANHHQMCLLPKDSHLLAFNAETRVLTYTNQHNQLTYLPVGFKEPEAAWFPNIKGFGVQWHPEWMADGTHANQWLIKQLEHYRDEVAV